MSAIPFPDLIELSNKLLYSKGGCLDYNSTGQLILSASYSPTLTGLTLTGTLTLSGTYRGTDTTDATDATGTGAGGGAIGTLGGVSIKKALWVGGLVNIAGAATITGGIVSGGSYSQSVDGGNDIGAIASARPNNLYIKGDFAINTNKFTVAGSTGNTVVAGTLAVTGVISSSATSTINTSGWAATLQTPRAINGVNFDGSAAITVTAAAGTLTGTTLNSTVTASSLTSVGGSLTVGSTLFTVAASTGNTVVAGTLTVSGAQIFAGAGTASLPAYSFTGDPDTGMWNKGANACEIVAGGQATARCIYSGAIADNGTYSLSGNFQTYGIFMVYEDNNGYGAIFGCNGGGVAPILVSDPYGKFSVTAGTAGKTNIYSTGGVLTLQNKNGATSGFTFIHLGA